MKNTLILTFLILLILSIPPVFASELNKSLTYDGNGNLITGDGRYREYNEFNQLVRVYNGSINDSDHILEEYVYHPTEDKILIKYWYEPIDILHSDIAGGIVYVNENLEESYDLPGGPSFLSNFTYYYFDDNGVAGEIIKNRTYFENVSDHYYYPRTLISVKNLSYHNDYSGSVSLITNSSGSIVEEIFYEPFGGILEGGNASRYSYEGKEFDSLTEDYDFHFRKYDPSLMVFTQPDSVVVNVYDPQTLNRYAFERNNPYKHVDETGKYISPLDVLDYASLVQSTIQLIKDPNFGNLGWFALDLVSAAVPVIGGFGAAGKAIKYGSKAVDAADNVNDVRREVQAIADRLGPASSAVEGTLKHSDARQILESKGLKGVYTEISIKDSTVVSYGTSGSVRLDVLHTGQDVSKIGTSIDPSQVFGMYDYKFGASGLTDSRISKINKETEISRKLIQGVSPSQTNSLAIKKGGFFSKIFRKK